MEGLKREQLESGKIYYCRLSQRNVLVLIQKENIEVKEEWPDKQTPQTEVTHYKGITFNARQGILQEEPIFDFQLVEISE